MTVGVVVWVLAVAGACWLLLALLRRAVVRHQSGTLPIGARPEPRGRPRRRGGGAPGVRCRPLPPAATHAAPVTAGPRWPVARRTPPKADQQLDLFAAASAENGAAAGSKPLTGKGSPPPEPSAVAGASLGAAGVPIPVRCPVTGTRHCHRDGCRDYRSEGEGRCAHPEEIAGAAKRRPGRRRQAKR